jgi:hypothetical protein
VSALQKLIICLPIAKWYADKGYIVYWPIDKNIIYNFIGYVDYVNFIPIDFNCAEAYQVCRDVNCSTIIDLAFCIPQANTLNTANYTKQDMLSFDAYKYYLADVPFSQKWTLDIKRNAVNEQKILDTLPENSYFLVQDTSSDCKFAVNVEDNACKRVDIDNRSISVFDWLGALQKADKLILIESCFSNLVDQLGIQTKENILLLKHGYYGAKTIDGGLKGIPILKLDWKKI